MWVQKCKRSPRFECFDPQCCLAEFDRKGIAVDSVNAVLDDLSECSSANQFIGGVSVSSNSGEFGGHAPGRS